MEHIMTEDEISNLLSTLHTNMVNLDRVYYDMFINTTPMDIILERYDENGVLKEYTLPNRAKDSQYMMQGIGSPNGVVSANAGVLYLDIQNTALYFKSVGTGTSGWNEVYSPTNFKDSVDYLTPSGKGTLLTDLNADNFSTGTLAPSRGGTGKTTFVEGDDYISSATAYSSVAGTFALNNGNINAQGTPDILTYSGYTLSFKVGGTFPTLKGTTAKGTRITFNSISPLSFSGMGAGTYVVFLKSNSQIDLILSSNIYRSASAPVTPVEGAIWVSTLLNSLNVLQYTAGNWVDYLGIPTGYVYYSGTAINSALTFEFINSVNKDYVVDLGTITSGVYLRGDRVLTANITNSCNVVLPTLFTTRFMNCLIDFTIGVGVTLTLPANVRWRYGIVPTYSSSFRNRLIFDTVDGGATWVGYYSQIGG